MSRLAASPSAPPDLTPLTRREFYQLTERCRAYALELAQFDQTRVNLPQCHHFNQWLQELKRYDRLAPALHALQPARPIARWQLLILAGMLGLIIWLALQARDYRLLSTGFLTTYLFFLIFFYFVPERYYGTTVELIEGKVLRIVDLLDDLLQHGELEFTEAAYFQAKTNLQEARAELRQQIDLAHRRWR
ncbi:MAG: hypothetical protein KF832_27780 [Caldilineaceae bacterium]|nr:hypothetical protein [Caldilineaceae bacterium]